MYLDSMWGTFIKKLGWFTNNKDEFKIIGLTPQYILHISNQEMKYDKEWIQISKI